MRVKAGVNSGRDRRSRSYGWEIEWDLQPVGVLISIIIRLKSVKPTFHRRDERKRTAEQPLPQPSRCLRDAAIVQVARQLAQPKSKEAPYLASASETATLVRFVCCSFWRLGVVGCS
jgi:hypothetical protein